jgi:hypothetical protein
LLAKPPPHTISILCHGALVLVRKRERTRVHGHAYAYLPPGTAIVVTDGSCKHGDGGYAEIITVGPTDAGPVTSCQAKHCSAVSCAPVAGPAAAGSMHGSDPGHVHGQPINVTLTCGGCTNTTSGTMELMAAYRCRSLYPHAAEQRPPHTAPHRLLIARAVLLEEA